MMRLTIAILALALSAVTSGAVDKFVRIGASGSNNGTDWDNAWTNTTQINYSQIAAGTTVYIAAGTYTNLSPAKAGNATNYVTYSQASSNNPACTSVSGWQGSYDGKVTIHRIICNTAAFNYWQVVGNFFGSMTITNTATNATHNIDFGATGTSFVNFRNLDIGGMGKTNVSYVANSDGRCWNASALASGNTFTNCWFHNQPTLVNMGRQNGTVFSGCKFEENFVENTADNHPNVLQSFGSTNVIVENSTITNWVAEGFMLCFVTTNDPPNDTWTFKGNLFVNAGSVGRAIESQAYQYRIRVFNNTFANIPSYGFATANGGVWTASCVSSNNIFFNTGSPRGFNQGSDDYNLSDGVQPASSTHGITNATSSIFVDYVGGNFNTVTNIGTLFPRNKGVALAAAYNTDPVGTIRGFDGAWDIGRDEVVVPSEVVPVPTDLRCCSVP
jgi:hypothetical protein